MSFFKKSWKKVLLSIFVIILLIIGGSMAYLIPSLSVDQTSTAYQELSTYNYEEKNDYYYFASTGIAEQAIIIYQGARVESLNYARIASYLQKDYAVFITKLPLNWAFLNMNLAEKIIEDYPSINEWFIGGHSLGGVMASEYVYDHLDDTKIAGVFFWASYSSKDFSETQIPMLYIFAERDGLVTSENIAIAEAEISLSQYSSVQILIGANHSQFGNYGVQSKDNTATITPERQQQQIAETMDFWIKNITKSNN